MCVRALRIMVPKSAGNSPATNIRSKCRENSASSNLLCHEVRNFLRAAIFERRRGRLGSKISGHGQLADVAVTSPCPVYLESRHHSERSACPWGQKRA